ncbi:hypothetical protein HN682_07905 [Candidatus Peregrinibacteria bacterium]|nr:hypothetical protein [Candidatus Peregrinibacteria bacterium]
MNTRAKRFITNTTLENFKVLLSVLFENKFEKAKGMEIIKILASWLCPLVCLIVLRKLGGAILNIRVVRKIRL